MFIDEVSVKLRAGQGGHGAVSFRREKYLPKGGPDGGNGGKGGDVILECDENVGDLRAFYYQPQWAAKNGGGGAGRLRTGAGGADCILKVPPGLEVYALEPEPDALLEDEAVLAADDPLDEVPESLDAEAEFAAEPLQKGEDWREQEPVVTLLEHGQRHVLLAGGGGGRGNHSFKSSINRAPRQFTEGRPGERGQYRFVLKTIADLGLVGFPNAGKSTLVNMVTNARPSTGAYPFTTKQPSVGIIEYPDRYERRKIADIPGLIRGAHENKGMGHRFLRHIERCRALVLILDMAGIDGRDPRDDYAALLDELAAYDPALVEKPRLVAANKMDEPTAAAHLTEFRAAYPQVAVWPVSCLLEEGLPDLLEGIYEMTRPA